MSMLGIDLLRQWDSHNRKHDCYYDSEWSSGEDCPSSYPNLRAYLEAAGFPVEGVIGQFFGRDLNEPNFRSRISGTEFPVEKPVSISDRRKTHTLTSSRAASRYYTPTTDDVLRERAERASKADTEPTEKPWEVEAMEYFKERLDEIHESMVRAFAGVMAEQSKQTTLLSDLLTSVNALEEKIDERSESRVAVEPKTVVTLDGVPADIADELQAELSKRLDRMLRRRRTEESRRRSGIA